uniref:Mediator of RNA polymerase II transcription subunit 31 n=1 Tax=Cebus imitator TaxID=2715852 RepID=A0A2K5Q8X2_CEBIM
MVAAVAMETGEWLSEPGLEFVQCLANPNYLNCKFLSTSGYFKDKAFVNYLKYLLYWKDPEHAKYLNVYTLELLQYEHFQKELVNAQCRMRLLQALAEQQQQNNTSGK